MSSRICQFQSCEGLNISPASGVHKRLGNLTEHTSSAWILSASGVRGGLLENPDFPTSLLPEDSQGGCTCATAADKDQST